MIEAIQAVAGSLVCLFSGVCFRDLSIANVQIDPVNALIGLAIGAFTLALFWRQDSINNELRKLEFTRAWLAYLDRRPNITFQALDAAGFSVRNESNQRLMLRGQIRKTWANRQSSPEGGMSLLSGEDFKDMIIESGEKFDISSGWLDYGSVLLLIQDIDTGYMYLFGKDFSSFDPERGVFGIGHFASDPGVALQGRSRDFITAADFLALNSKISSRDQLQGSVLPLELFETFRSTLY